MGVVSTRTGSLQVALGLPFAAAVGLLGMAWISPRVLPRVGKA
jgi:MFS transporter, FHS family, glucose/mannose:H+ symporter